MWACVCGAVCDQVECEVGAPQVNYRESISRQNDVRYVHKKQSGGSGQFADVAIKFEPGEPGTGFVFRSEIKGGAGERDHLPTALMGVSLQAGLCEQQCLCWQECSALGPHGGAASTAIQHW